MRIPGGYRNHHGLLHFPIIDMVKIFPSLFGPNNLGIFDAIKLRHIDGGKRRGRVDIAEVPTTPHGQYGEIW